MKNQTTTFTIGNFANIAAFLRRGGIGVLPTDTTLGFSCDCANPAAVAALQEIKGRARSKPFLLLCGNLQIAQSVVCLSIFAKNLIRKILQAGESCTVILPRKAGVLPAFFPREKCLAVRIPPEKNLQNFLENFWKKPLVSTSVNLAGQQCATDFASVEKIFAGKNLLLFRGQNFVATRPSTILKIMGTNFQLLREGNLLKNKIELLAREILQ